MNNRAKENLEELYSSMLFGNCQYVFTGEKIKDPFYAKESGLSIVLKNIFTDELFFTRYVNKGSYELEHYKKKVLKKPKYENVLWPSDIVEIPDEIDNLCDINASNIYLDHEVNENSNKRLLLLFPLMEYKKLRTFQECLKSISTLNWKNPEVMEFATKIIKGINDLNETGYLFFDFNFNRILFDESNNIYFDFTNLFYDIYETISYNDAKNSELKLGDYPIEFAEPCLAQEKITIPDYNTQNYMLTALLFYLFVGRHPYDGRLLYDKIDSNLFFHYDKFLTGLRLPIFIFDEEDKSNCLSITDLEEEHTLIWTQLPDTIKTVFGNTLKRSNAERDNNVFNPTPKTWMRLIELNMLNAK